MAVTTGVSDAAVTTGMDIGAAVGTAFGPAGTLIGAGVGALAGLAVSYFSSGAINRAVNATSTLSVAWWVGDIKSWF